MIPIEAISSVVTAVTATIFILIIKNLKENNSKDFEKYSNELISQEILTELAADSYNENFNENEIDYELLEEKFKLLENLDKNEFIEEMKGEEEIEISEVKIVESKTINNFIESQADLLIEATHNLKNSGQHRPYTLSLHFTPRPRGEKELPIPWTHCKLHVEWPLPKNVFIDVWSLKRLTSFTIDHYPSHVLNPSNIIAGTPGWSVKPRHPDLEVGSYDPKARPFILTADIPFRHDRASDSSRIEGGKLFHTDAPWNLDLHVPDLVIRYQQPKRGTLFQKHPNRVAFLPAPNLQFKCVRPDEQDSAPTDLHVDWQLNRLRPLQVTLPIGSATPVIGHVTIASVFLSSLFLLVTLFKF